MRFASLSLLALFSVLTGCAAAAEGDASTDAAEASQTVASAPDDVGLLTGSYRYSGVPQDFDEIAELSLESAGDELTYTAEVDSRIVNPRQRCVTSPCTATEVGTWKVLRPADAGFLTLVLEPRHNLSPNGNAPRAYRVKLAKMDPPSMTLTRRLSTREVTARLFKDAPLPPPVCLAFPSCSPDEVELEPGETCGFTQECRTVSMCGHSITCAKSRVTCMAFPSCASDEEQLEPGQTCGVDQACRVVSMCGQSITCAKKD